MAISPAAAEEQERPRDVAQSSAPALVVGKAERGEGTETEEEVEEEEEEETLAEPPSSDGAGALQRAIKVFKWIGNTLVEQWFLVAIAVAIALASVSPLLALSACLKLEDEGLDADCGIVMSNSNSPTLRDREGSFTPNGQLVTSLSVSSSLFRGCRCL